MMTADPNLPMELEQMQKTQEDLKEQIQQMSTEESALKKAFYDKIIKSDVKSEFLDT